MTVPLARGLSALVLALVVVVLPAPPQAPAAPAPWTWVRVTHQVDVLPETNYAERAHCPEGYTAITGGLLLPAGSQLIRRSEYRASDGSYWQVNFRNESTSSGSATVVAECARTADLPAFSYQIREISRNSGGWFEGIVSCAGANEAVVTGGADWNFQPNSRLNSSGPGWDGNSWRAAGINSSSSAKLFIEVYCVDPSQVPGFDRVEAPQSTESNTVTCPPGTRILNGGSEDGYANTSYPHLNTWTTADNGNWDQTGAFIRAWCVSAGTPYVSLDFASPGPDGVITNDPTAQFTYSGGDPAGFSPAFRCALGSSPPGPCPAAGIAYNNLGSSPQIFQVFALTADGRTSPVASYRWTVDTIAPTLTAPAMPRIGLSEEIRATWSGDDNVSLGHYEAQFWRGRADGTTTGWQQPAAWTHLTSPSVQLPRMVAAQTLCLSVRAVDVAGNESAWTAPRCTTRPHDDRALSATDGWVRRTGAQFWQETVSTTTARGESLSRPDVHLRQVGVLATVCPTCGDVRVKVAGVTIGTISTRAGTTRHRRVLLLPAFVPREGRVVLTSVTADRSVRIDGLLTIRMPAGGPTS